MNWKCKICGISLTDSNMEEHFKKFHCDKDADDIVCNLIEQDGICLILTKAFGIDVIKKDGIYYRDNRKGMVEEFPEEEYLTDDVFRKITALKIKDAMFNKDDVSITFTRAEGLEIINVLEK